MYVLVYVAQDTHICMCIHISVLICPAKAPMLLLFARCFGNEKYL